MNRHAAICALGVLATGGCAETIVDPPDPVDVPGFANCDLDTNLMIAASSRDGIPSLDEPVWLRADESVPDYLDPTSRVIGLVANGTPFAVPFNVLWHHEIVNLDSGGPNAPKVGVTYCPLTGSSLVFDRASVGGATLGVSGLLFMNNLLVYDRRDPDDTLWPQMIGAARCGSRSGAEFERYPFVEMEWGQWVALHPQTQVLAGAAAQGFNPIQFNYTEFGYPYATYRETDPFFNSQIMPDPDTRRFAKERVLGVPTLADEGGSDESIAFPFGALTDEDGDFSVVSFTADSEDAVVLWSDAAQGGGVFRSATENGATVTLEATPLGFEDTETGSEWTVDGRAVAGPLSGEVLVPVTHAHTAFWGAWAAFHPSTRLWTGG